MADYGFSSASASHLMGQVVRYDIGNVFDPAYTIACRRLGYLFDRAGSWLAMLAAA